MTNPKDDLAGLPEWLRRMVKIYPTAETMLCGWASAVEATGGGKMTDRELLELAARAAGIALSENGKVPWTSSDGSATGWRDWNPLTDDGDALRLAVKLRQDLTFNEIDVMAWPTDGSLGESELINVDDPYAATRRAIVRAAAVIAGESEHG